MSTSAQILQLPSLLQTRRYWPGTANHVLHLPSDDSPTIRMTRRGASTYRGGMEVTFARTGERRYGVLAVAPGQAPQWINSAPGYDPDVPHDLVHYLVEAELTW